MFRLMHNSTSALFRWQLSAFPGPTATHTGRDSSVDVAWSVFHLDLKEGNVPSFVRELENCVFQTAGQER